MHLFGIHSKININRGKKKTTKRKKNVFFRTGSENIDSQNQKSVESFME